MTIENAIEEVETSGEKEICLSQRDYRPTPYRASQWEGIETLDRNPTFKAINLEVMENEGLAFDPMFEQFDAHLRQKPQYGEVIEEVEELAPVMNEELIAEIRAQAFEEGRQAGLQEGILEAQSGIIERYEALSRTLGEITSNIKSELDQRISDLETKAVTLALDISKRILSTTAEVKPEYIIDVIRRALSELGTQKGLVIRISHQDYEFLEVVGLPEDLMGEKSKIKYIADEKIVSGCVVETEYGSVNLELDHMWNEVKDKIYSTIS